MVPAPSPHGRVEDVAPPQAALLEGRGLLVPSEQPGPPAECRVGDGVLQGLGRSAPAVADVLGRVVGLQVLGEIGPLSGALAGASRVGQPVRVGHGGLPGQGLEGALVVEVAYTHGVEGGEGGGRGIARHDVCGAVDVHPAVPDPAVLPGEVVQRLGEVPRDPRLEEGEELDLGAVLVPAGEVAVLRPLAALHAVRLPVHAGVAAVGVADQVRLHQRVVERGVERGALRLAAAADARRGQLAVPGGRSRPGHVVDARPRCDLLAEVGLGSGLADVGDPDPHTDVVVGRGVEADPAAGTTPGAVRPGGVPLAAAAAGGARCEGAVTPGARGGEGAVEGGAEVEPVVALAVVGAAVGTCGRRRPR